MTISFDVDHIIAHFSHNDICEIKTLCDRSISLARSFLAVDDVCIKFYVDIGGVPPHWGLVGYAPGPNQITIVLDPNRPRFKDREGKTRFSAVVTHEWHHVCRHRGPGYGKTLGERLVSEGLALRFEEQCGFPPFPEVSFWRSKANISDLTARALPLLDVLPDSNRNFNVAKAAEGRSFFSGDIYDLGPVIVERFLSARNLTPSQAVDIDAQEILNYWKNTTCPSAMDRPTLLHSDTQAIPSSMTRRSSQCKSTPA